MTKLSVQQMLSRARAHEKSGEFNEARKVYEAILTDYPSNVRARKALDNLVAPASNLKRSEPRKQELDALVSLYNQGRLKDVINNGKALIGRYSSSHFLFNIVGAASGGLEQFVEAEDYFRRASQLEPDYADSHNNLGNVLKEQGKLEEAEISYRTALKLDPRFAEAHYNLGIVLDKQTKFEEAEDCYNRALRVTPNYAEAHNQLGVLQLAQSRYEEAIDCFKRALQIQPKLIEAHNNAGNAFLAMENHKDAASLFARALKIDPEFVDARISLGRSLRKLKRFKEAADQFAIAIETAPKNAAVYREMGKLEHLRTENEAAISMLRRALELRPNYIGAKIDLAAAYWEIGENESANEIMQAIIDSGVSHPSILPLITTRPFDVPKQYLLSEMDKLINNGETLNEKNRENFVFTLGNIMHRVGEYKTAAKHFIEGNNLVFKRSLDEVKNKLSRNDLCLQFSLKAGPRETLNREGAPIPLFILGPSRSGKSTLEKLFSVHAGVKCGYESADMAEAMMDAFNAAGLRGGHRYEELPENGHDIFTSTAEKLISQRADSADVLTYTLPSLIYNSNQFAYLVPNARFVFVKRNIDDLITRIFMTKYANENHLLYNIGTINKYISNQFALMDDLAQKYPDIVRIIKYEDLVTDVDGSMKQVTELCGIADHDRPFPSVGNDQGCAELYREFFLSD